MDLNPTSVYSLGTDVEANMCVCSWRYVLCDVVIKSMMYAMCAQYVYGVCEYDGKILHVLSLRDKLMHQT